MPSSQLQLHTVVEDERRFQMTGKSFGVRLAVCVIGAALPLLARGQAQYSSSQLHKMMREANTADQYRTLATWFRGEEAAFRAKAVAENEDYNRYKTTARTKLPTRADNARSQAESYSNKAIQMASLASLYESQLARLDPTYRPTTVTAASLCQVQQPLQSSAQ
jgi:hypothetical protein